MAKIVSGEEVGEMPGELVVTVVMIAFDGGFLDCPVHSFDLTVGPGVIGFGQSVFDAMCSACTIEHMHAQPCRGSIAARRQIAKLDAVVRQDGMNFVGDGLDQGLQESRSGMDVGAFLEVGESEFGCPINGNEELELAFGSLNLGNIDVKVADRVGFEFLLRRLVTVDIDQATDAMSLKASMQRRSCKVRNRRLQTVETVVERQQRMPAEGDDDRFIFGRQNGGLRLFRPSRKIGDRSPFLPLGAVF